MWKPDAALTRITVPVNASNAIERLYVVADADGLTSRAGTAVLAGWPIGSG